MSATLKGLKRVRKDIHAYRGFLVVAYMGRWTDHKVRRLFAVCMPFDLENRYLGRGWEGGIPGDEVRGYALRYGNSRSIVHTQREGAVSDIDWMHQKGIDFRIGERDLAWLREHPEEVPLLLAQWPDSEQLKGILEAL